LPDPTVDAAVVAFATVATGVLSWFGLNRTSGEIDPGETRASRALFDAWEAAVILGSIAVGRLIAEARHASLSGKLLAIALGALAGGLIWAVSHRPVARLLAAALRAR
jgi:hypothetical protein